MDAETGFLLHRSVMLALMATMLVVFGRFGLPLLIIAAQVFGAGAEIMRELRGMPDDRTSRRAGVAGGTHRLAAVPTSPER